MVDAIPRPEMEMLAAEYVLGLLDTDDQRAAEGLAGRDGTMRMLVEDWALHLASLNTAYAPIAAPDVWPDLDRQLFAPRRRRNRLFLLVVAGIGVALVVKVVFWSRLMF